MSELHFDPERHRYTIGDETLPSVTQILRSAGLVDYSRVPPDVLQAAADRGTRVHLACVFVDEGSLEWESVAAEERRYVEAYEKFLAESGFRTDLVEHRVWHRELRYAGTLDRTGTMPDGSRYLIDLKTGQVDPSAWVQLAAYQACLEWDGVGYLRRVLHLQENGNYSLIPPGNDSMRVPEEEFNAFRAALVVHRWKERNR